ncbi:hypothetical protein ACK9U2_001200 [Pseudomonas putida]
MDTQPNSSAPENKGGLISDLYNLTIKYPALNFLVTLVTGAAAGAAVSYKYIDEKVNSAADKRLLPYMSVFSGMNLNQSEDYKQAVQEFESLITSKQIDTLSKNSKALTYDALLHSLANSDDIASHKVLLSKTILWLSQNVEETGWRQHEIGWSFMRIGELDKAKDHFSDAINLFRAERDYAASGDSFRGLLIIALIENKPDRAFAIAQDLKELLPAVYRDNSDLIAEIRENRKRKYFDVINALHEETLEKSVPKYIDMLEKQKSKHSKIADKKA